MPVADWLGDLLMGVDVAARGLLGTAGPTDLIQDWLGARA
jgi:hypothetical protein